LKKNKMQWRRQRADLRDPVEDRLNHSRRK
jgi:hypothetical protein